MDFHSGLLRNFTRQLDALRFSSGMSQIAIAAQMEVSGSKISRVFNGKQLPSLAELHLMLSVMQAPEGARTALLRTWRAARASRPSLRGFEDILGQDEMDFYEGLQHADDVRLFGGQTIPLAVRTPAFHALMLQSQEIAHIERWMDLLPEIQLVHNPGRRLLIVLDESVFCRNSTPGFAEQMDALLSAHEQGARIRVVPFLAGLLPGMMQPLSVLSWDEDPDLLAQISISYLHQAVQMVTDADHRRTIVRQMSQIEDASTPPELLPAIIQLARGQGEARMRTVIPA